MTLSLPIRPSRPSTAPSATNVHSLDPASSAKSPSKNSRKPAATITPNDIAFSPHNSFQSDDQLAASPHRKSTPSFSALPSYQRVTASPSQASFPVARSAFANSATDLTSAQLSSSFTRNSSVPTAIFHATRSPDTPNRYTLINQTRPSLSSPSPPTPIVPSIPLRHATQHSPAAVVTSLPMPHATSPLERRFPPVKFPVDQSPTAVSFATSSDPNMSSRCCNTTPDPNQYSLPLKKLLSKPATPSIFHAGSDTEGVDSSFHHQRSLSTAASVQFSSHDLDDSSVERAAILSLRSHAGFKDRNGHGYNHYHGSTDHAGGDRKSKGRKHSSQASADQPVWWPSWRQGEKESKSKGGGKDKVPNAPRNVLKRRPSNSLKSAEPRSPTPSGSRSLTRSLSASSLLKRAGFTRQHSPSVASPYSAALNLSPAQVIQPTSSYSSDLPLSADPSKASETDHRSAHSHVEHTSAENVHDANSNNNVVTGDDMPTSVLLPNPWSPPRVLKDRPSDLSLSIPVSKGTQQTAGTRLSTISSVSGSSAGSKRREKVLSPAGSIAEAYKREQLGDKSETSPSNPTAQSSSPRSPSATGSVTDKVADNMSSGKRSSNSGLSYADIKSRADNVIQNKTSLDSNVKEEEDEHPQQVSLEIDGVVVTNSVVTYSSPNPAIPSTPTPTISRSSISSPPLSIESRTRNRLKKSRHTSDQVDSGSRPYYTVVGTRSEKVFSVGGPRDSLGEDWGVRTVITAGRPSTSDGIKGRASFSKSLTRKISGKFKRERSLGPGDEKLGMRDDEAVFDKSLTRKVSGKFKQGRPATAGESRAGLEEKVIFGDNEYERPLNRKSSVTQKRNQFNGDNDGTLRGRAMPQHGRTTSTVSPPRPPEDIPDQKSSDDRCLPYFYSAKKHSQSEIDLAAKEKSNGKFPKFWRLFGRSRSKSRETNDQGFKYDDPPPPLPALPKHYVTDHRNAHISPPPRKNSYSSKSSPSTPSGRPSTATSENAPVRFWNRHNSAPSSTSSLEVPPTSSPRIDLKRYATTDDTNRPLNQKYEALNATRLPRVTHEIYNHPAEAGRSNSPPIPSFSTVDTINSFRPRPSSSDRSKNGPTSNSATSSPASPPIRPARSSRRLKEPAQPVQQQQQRNNTFGDDALYPPVMKPSTRSSPKMTYRELASGKEDVKKKLTEEEKADRWVALLEKSDAAGGTLHFGGVDDKLPSDDLRFSRTLSELARDDDDD